MTTQTPGAGKHFTTQQHSGGIAASASAAGFQVIVEEVAGQRRHAGVGKAGVATARHGEESDGDPHGGKGRGQQLALVVRHGVIRVAVHDEERGGGGRAGAGPDTRVWAGKPTVRHNKAPEPHPTCTCTPTQQRTKHNTTHNTTHNIPHPDTHILHGTGKWKGKTNGCCKKRSVYTAKKNLQLLSIKKIKIYTIRHIK